MTGALKWAGAAFLALVVVGAFAYVTRSAPFWPWWGWTALGSIAQSAVVVGTAVTLLFVNAQLRHQRDHDIAEAQRRQHEYERQQTPYLSLEFNSISINDGEVTAQGQLHGDGYGVAYEVYITASGPSPLLELSGKPSIAHVRYLRAPGSADVNLSWTRRPHEQLVWLEGTFENLFGQRVSFRQNASARDTGLELSGAPTYTWPWAGKP